MPLYFITGNENKFKDAQSVIRNLEQIDIDLPEIQELDPKLIIKAKLQEAFKHAKGEFIVDDVSLTIDELNGLPGPLIKWFIKSLDFDGIAQLANSLKSNKAKALAMLGYAKSPDDIYFFESEVSGQIVTPRGKGGFGWDVIFQPDDSPMTYAEIKESTKAPNKMRMKILNELKQFLESQ